MSVSHSGWHQICLIQGCLGSVHIRWKLSPAKSRHDTQASAMTVRAAIREGGHHADVARLQCGIHAHTHSTQSTPLASEDPEQPTRDPALSPSIQRTPERSTALKRQLSRLYGLRTHRQSTKGGGGRGGEAEQNHTKYGQ